MKKVEEKTCDTCSKHVDISIMDEEKWYVCSHSDNTRKNWVP